MENKILIEAILRPFKISSKKRKEIASSLQLPTNSQSDLMFMSAILVSTGTNKNGATFLGSELIKARGSISQKALDIEHVEQKVIGHIASSMYLDHSGELVDDASLYTELSSETASAEDKLSTVAKLDAMSMDIGIICVVYKDRFPELATQIENNEWKVSMECYYDDFDIKIGNLILPKASNSELFAKLDTKLKNDLKVVLAGTSMGTGNISRVLRDVRFCGVGIVKNPANDRSIVLEAASQNLDKYAKIEQIMQEAASLSEVETSIKESTQDFTEVTTDKDPANVIQVKAGGFFILKNGSELVKDSYYRNYNDIAKEVTKRSALDIDGKYYIVEANSIFQSRNKIELNETSEAVTYKTDDVGNIEEIHTLGVEGKESSQIAVKYGPADRSSGLCVSFEKYVRAFPGSAYPGRIVATHWCKLFNKPCTVLGADAHDTACLRNKFSHLVNEGDLFDGAIIKSPFNPRIHPDATTLAVPEERKIEDTANQLSEDEPAPASKVVEEAPEGVEPLQVVAPDNTDVTPPASFMKQPAPISIGNPYMDFPTKVKAATAAERKSMSNEDFGLPVERRYPINSKERTQVAMVMFTSASRKLDAGQKETLYNRTLNAALKYGIDTTQFEEKDPSEKLEEEAFGIPRLKQLPLNNREQVIAAISRFRHLKVEISETEREHLVVNILRACKKFNIDATAFRERINIK